MHAAASTAWRSDLEPAFAALDLGTNNCRLLVATPTRAGFRVVDSFSRIVRLGEGLHAADLLCPFAMERTLEALHACTARLRRRPIRGLRAVATQACRQARNGPAFLDRVQAETGLRLEIIAPREEAELALESCRQLIARTARRALLFDIGGGSTEIAWVRLDARQGAQNGPEVAGFVSLPVGVASLGGRHGPAGFDAIVREVRVHLEQFDQVHRIAQEVRVGDVQAIGTSGTVTTLAGVAMRLPRYHRASIDGCELPAAAAQAAIDLLRGLGPDGLGRHPCVGPERTQFVLPGCAVVQAMQDTWNLPAITVADRGLREGMLLRLMRHHRLAPAARAALHA